MRQLLILVGLTVLAIPPGAAGAAGAVNETFRGSSSDSGRVVIPVVRGVVRQATIAFRARCSSHRTLSDSVRVTGPLRKGNSFSLTGERYSGPISGGFTGHFTVTIKFSIHGRTASGTFSDKAVIVKAGRVVDHCATGVLKFTARR